MPITVHRLIQPSAVTPPTPVTDTWTNVLTVPPPFDGSPSPYWVYNCVNTATNQLFCPGFAGGTLLVNLGTGTVTTVPASIWGVVENYKTVFDPLNNRYWVTEQTPSNGNFGGGGGGRSGYIGGNDPGGGAGFTASHFLSPNCPLGIAQGRWLIGCSLSNFYLGQMDSFQVFDLVTNTGVFGGAATGDIPPGSQAGLGGNPKEFTTAFDSRTGILYALAPTLYDGPDVQLYMCTGILQGAPRWHLMPTFGTHPPYTVLTVGYDEYSDCIIAWCGRDQWVSDGLPPQQTGTVPRQTYVLPLYSMIWRLGRGLAAGDTVPPANGFGASQNLAYDPTGRRMILTTSGSGTGLSVWAYQVGGVTL